MRQELLAEGVELGSNLLRNWRPNLASGRRAGVNRCVENARTFGRHWPPTRERNAVACDVSGAPLAALHPIQASVDQLNRGGSAPQRHLFCCTERQVNRVGNMTKPGSAAAVKRLASKE